MSYDATNAELRWPGIKIQSLWFHSFPHDVEGLNVSLCLEIPPKSYIFRFLFLSILVGILIHLDIF